MFLREREKERDRQWSLRLFASFFPCVHVFVLNLFCTIFYMEYFFFKILSSSFLKNLLIYLNIYIYIYFWVENLLIYLIANYYIKVGKYGCCEEKKPNWATDCCTLVNSCFLGIRAILLLFLNILILYSVKLRSQIRLQQYFIRISHRHKIE